MEISPMKFARTFGVQALFIFRKSKTRNGKNRDENQMFMAEALQSTTLSFDNRGEIYIDLKHFVDFKGVTKAVISTIPGNPVIISLGHTDGSTWELYILSTVDEICSLRSPIRPAIEDKQQAVALNSTHGPIPPVYRVDFALYIIS